MFRKMRFIRLDIIVPVVKGSNPHSNFDRSHAGALVSYLIKVIFLGKRASWLVSTVTPRIQLSTGFKSPGRVRRAGPVPPHPAEQQILSFKGTCSPRYHHHNI